MLGFRIERYSSGCAGRLMERELDLLQGDKAKVLASQDAEKPQSRERLEGEVEERRG